jgi:hypothetical protein
VNEPAAVGLANPDEATIPDGRDTPVPLGKEARLVSLPKNVPLENGRWPLVEPNAVGFWACLVWLPGMVGIAKPAVTPVPGGRETPVPVGFMTAVPLLENALVPFENGSLPVPEIDTCAPVPEI